MAGAQYFSFPVHSIDIVDSFERVYILKSSKKMNSYSDRIYLDCQGFLSQIAFYNDEKNGKNFGPDQVYDLDHAYCEYMAVELKELIENNERACIELNIQDYEPPRVSPEGCENNF
jgi:hypothetical protein